jgi:HAD domain in Swiss Army Knife RNA repair proteins
MRIVFLDFDGVLNADTAEVDTSSEMWSAAWLDATMVARMARLVQEANARVVVSSSWRQRRSREELESILAERGFTQGVHDVTPRLPRPPEGERFIRANEIAAWLATHPDVTEFVILDDDPELGDLAARHVHVDSTRGLTDEDVSRAMTILGVG